MSLCDKITEQRPISLKGWRMLMTRLAVFVCLIVALASSLRAADADPEAIVEMKIALPKDTFNRGGTNPVADLAVDVTLINKTEKEDRVPKKVSVDAITRFTAEELANLKKMTPDQQKELLAKKKESREIEVFPNNKDSLSISYVEPQLGPQDTITFIIVKLPEEGEVVPEGAEPNLIARDNLPDQATKLDAVPTHYLAAGETSPTFKIPVGHYFLARSPGMYSIRAVMRGIGDKKAPSPFEASKNAKLIQRFPAGYLTSNEEKFRVLPFKEVDAKIDELQSQLETFERGYPDFDYMLYQVKSDANFDEVYATKRIAVRGSDRWEWTRVCTVKTGTSAQVAQLASKKVVLLAVHAKGDAGLYNLDFTGNGVKVTSKTVPTKEGAAPKLKVEGGAVTVE